MEAKRLATLEDLWAAREERVELIGGAIVKRPMARSEHALIQSGIADEILPLKRRGGSGGWWIMPEISVAYDAHQCPSHDLAGWRKERLPDRPTGVMRMIPDWVCEITSPGHERKDVFHHFMLLQRYGVPFYWVISPEDRTLIAYALVDGKFRVVFSVECTGPADLEVVRIPPFDEVAIDLGYVFGKAIP